MITRIQLVLMVMTSLAFSQTFAQKYKFKRGTIYRDKEPVGIVVGEAGGDRTLFTVLTIENQEVMKVTHDGFSIKNPFLSSVWWYNVTFSDTGKTLKLDHGGNCGLRCVFKHVIFPAGILFNNAYIASQSEIFSKNDISESLHADTVRLINEHKQMLTLLKKPGIKRNRSSSVRLKLYNKEEDSRNPKLTYHILQDAEIVGKIIKTGSGYSIFEVYKKLAEPASDGEKFVPLGKSDTAVTNHYTDTNLRFTTVLDDKIHSFNIPSEQFVIARLAKYLVKKNYL